MTTRNRGSTVVAIFGHMACLTDGIDGDENDGADTSDYSNN